MPAPDLALLGRPVERLLVTKLGLLLPAALLTSRRYTGDSPLPLGNGASESLRGLHDDQQEDTDFGGELVRQKGTLSQWIAAGNLKPGSWLRVSNGTYVQLASVKHSVRVHQHVHNLTVEELNTYYVLAGSTPVLVHNTDGCRTFGSHSPTGRLNLPDTRGVYIIKMKDGKVYVGSATKGNTIHRRVHRAFSDDRHAVKSSGYKTSDVQEIGVVRNASGCYGGRRSQPGLDHRSRNWAQGQANYVPMR